VSEREEPGIPASSERTMRVRATRVVIADDSVLLRDGLVRLLEDGNFDVVAAVGTAEDLLKAVADEAPDLCIVDVRMPPSFTDEGIKAALTIRREHPGVAVVVLSHYVEERYAAELLVGDTAGVGYLLKDRVVEVGEFVDSVRRVVAGGSAIDAEVVSQILHRSKRARELERLTPRERDVLEAMAEGYSNRGIAEHLVISEGAVEKHISSIFTKLDLDPEDGVHRRVLAVLTYLSR
jgi:DNA-binding NarL/FixJ family response regulator